MNYFLASSQNGKNYDWEDITQQKLEGHWLIRPVISFHYFFLYQ